jgi:2-oxoglutarate ferredoxin oxidoreductase subunit alpha
MSDMPAINPPIAEANDKEYKPYLRDAETLVRKWALPGTEGLRHRIGGLEKENITGSVSMNPANHQLMTDLREAKVEKIADYIPKQEVIGDKKGDLLVVGWGSTYGVINMAIQELQAEGVKVSQTHFHYISPFPKNTAELLSKFNKILVCELNSGQLVNYFRMKFPKNTYTQFNKVQGLPFVVSEIKEKIIQTLKEK